MKVFVTGATGFVGRNLVAELARRNHDVVACVRKHPDGGELDLDNVTICSVPSISTEIQWKPLLDGVDVVVHAAAQVSDGMNNASSIEYRHVNVDGTVHLAQQAESAGVKRFVFISSIKAHGTGHAFPVQPSSSLRPDDDYGKSKLEAEQKLFDLAKRTTMSVTVVRPPLVYGPGVKANFSMLMRAVYRGIPLPLGAIKKNRRSMVFIANLTDVLACLIHHPAAANEVFLVSDGQDISTRNLVEMIGAAMNRPARMISISPKLLYAVAKIFGKEEAVERLTGSLCADISKTQRLLSWKPPFSMAEGIQCTVNDFLSHATDR